ncbi:hypothetical protein ACROYT_G022997 [Oculina patagonica]
MYSKDKSGVVVIFLLVAIFISAAVGAPNQDSSVKAIKSFEATVDKRLKQLIDVVKNATYHGNSIDKPGSSFASCKDIFMKHKDGGAVFQVAGGNKAYPLQMDSGKTYHVYCHMTSKDLRACGGGGWTLVMKIDGHKPTFHYDSKFWSNKNDFNLPGGKTLFDTQETKLPTYWNTPFSKICLGMKIGHQFNFIVINKHANSLHSLIADGHYRPSKLGRNKWKILIGSEASL